MLLVRPFIFLHSPCTLGERPLMTEEKNVSRAYATGGACLHAIIIGKFDSEGDADGRQR